MDGVRSLRIPGPVGLLDSRWHGPVDGPPVVLLHPHPRFGGTMGSRLVYDLAIALAEAGMQAVRFDFRGVGRSDGSYAEGLGEAEDAAAVLAHAEAATGRRPAVAGYSFGGAVACRLATLRELPRLVLLATPLRVLQSALDPQGDAPRAKAADVTSVVADDDPHVTLGEARRLAAAFPRPARLVTLQGAGHLLDPARSGPAVAAAVAALAG